MISFNIGIILIIALLFFYGGYRIYSSYIARIFDENDENITPACSINDGVDYVPSKPFVVFCHHFSSIAAAGPIVGPTIALIYGFVPVWIWIIVGNIFAGAVHDFTAMFTSIREKGKSIADVAKGSIGRGAFFLFITFAIIALIMVAAVFLRLTAAALTSFVPLSVIGLSETQTLLNTRVIDGVVKAQIGGIASTSVIIITLFAPFLGYLLYKRRIKNIFAIIIALTVCFGSVVIGMSYPISIDPIYWMVFLSLYTFVAAGIPVWFILQPRDFINSFFLFFGIIAMVFGAILAGLKGATFSAPAWNIGMGTERLGQIWPILFITVACGAISGFHALVSSGTSCKQVNKESHVRKIGYGAMILEGVMAIGVLIAVGSGLSFDGYLDIVHPLEKFKENPVLGFSLGLGGVLYKGFSLPIPLGTIFGILLVEGFLVTTLDTTVRLTRYLFEEVWAMVFKDPPAFLKSYLFNSGLCVALMFLLGYNNAISSIWPIFGSANQLLAGLTLITVTTWLARRGKKYWFTLLPAVFMLLTTLYSLFYLLQNKYLPARNFTLIGADILLIFLALGLIGLSLRLLFTLKIGIVNLNIEDIK